MLEDYETRPLDPVSDGEEEGSGWLWSACLVTLAYRIGEDEDGES